VSDRPTSAHDAPDPDGTGDPLDALGAVPDPLATVERSVEPEGTVVLALRGEVDVSNASYVRGEVTSAIAEVPAHLVFDLADLGFMDSSGLAILLAAAKSVPVRLRNPSESIVRLVELTGLSTVLPLEGAGEGGAPAGSAGD
jgi:anti-anti-sigma factor